MRVSPGQPYPLGATWDGTGVNFAIFSENAAAVELCLLERPGDAEESARIPVTRRTDGVWHVHCADLRPGQLYGYRVHGPYAPQEGHRFNPNKLLLDPYAKAVSGPARWHESQRGYTPGDEQEDLSFDSRNSAAVVPKSIVVDSAFAWGDDRPPRVPWDRTVIYECHVKGLTARHPGVAPDLRGTFAGLASGPIIEHLSSLGVTTVELLPVQQAFDEKPLVERGLVNYWAYNTVGFFAPHARYATDTLGRQVHEFQSMVAALHGAGIEVVLDVVYNHTGEGNHRGPTLCLRGIDNAVYYRLDREDRRRYEDFTWCGNTLDLRHPRVLQLVLDSLRYWVQDMHVDGFRFDLTPALARGAQGFEREHAFFAAVLQDPVLTQVKLIAEPWDLGPGGYQLGNFPRGWAEWNGRFRDGVRRYWRGDEHQLGEIARRLSGSSDVFAASGRDPCASINYVTAHDGFTLHDLVSYERKHNEANGEENRDGYDDNVSCNWGAEGPTNQVEISQLREQMKRNFLATVAFSLGVPMLSAGDELGRTQQGNNNAYCQDSEISWVNWELDQSQTELLAFARRVLAIRRENTALFRCAFFRGDAECESGVKDLTWLRPNGAEMAEADWGRAKQRALGMLMHRHGSDEGRRSSPPAVPRTLLLLLNAGRRSCRFRLPAIAEPGRWLWVLSTASDRAPTRSIRAQAVRVQAHSLVVLRYEQTA
jgi:isoamylase